MGICLYVGADDSNHAGGEIKGEINAVTLSPLHSDSVVRAFANRREDYSRVVKWLSHPLRDYRFTILTGEFWRTRADNLVYTTPALIDSYLLKHPEIDAIRLFLDGFLNASGKAYLKDHFKGYDFVVRNFIKKGKNKEGRTVKRPVYPPLIHMADAWAHALLGRSLEDCFTDPRFVSFSLQQ